MNSELHRLRARFAAAVDQEICQWITMSNSPPRFAGMMQYQLGYVDEHFHPSTGGGKRFRPLLCLVTTEAAGGSWRAALPVAAAIELLHNFSLIHDDIEDHDSTRHHRPTVWKVWGEAQAVNAGDGLFALANRALLGVETIPQVTLALARSFEAMCLALTEGQFLDMSFEGRQDVSADEYVRMISLKTGALIAFSTWSGGMVGGADDATCQALRDFGAQMGKAFQIHDDLMGIWGPRTVTGKEAAKDLVNRKKTLPLLLAQEHADDAQRAMLREFLAGESDDVGAVLGVLDATGAQRQARERVTGYLAGASAALARARITAEGRKELAGLAEELVDGR